MSQPTEFVEEEEDGENPVVSERVQSLAQGIYDQFQHMVEEYGPESIGELMPLVVNVLENLDSALADNQDHLSALMGVNEENEQLSKQYEREKQRRKEIEDKAMRMEDVNEQELRELKDTVSRLSLGNKDLQGRMKAQKEQIERVEERHESLKKEKKELHDRNIDLIRNFHGKIESMKETGAIKITRGKSLEEVAESPVAKQAPGFADFISPPKDSKKKRHLPIAPGRRGRAMSGDDDDSFLSTTPAIRPDSPEYRPGRRSQSPPNLISLHDEQDIQEEEEPGDEDEDLVPNPHLYEMSEEFDPNQQSLLAEMHFAQTGSDVPGFEDIISENEQLMTQKNDLTKEVDDLHTKLRETEQDKQSAESEKANLQEEKEKLISQLRELDMEVKTMRRELEDARDRSDSLTTAGGEGMGLTKLEVARVLRERNEYKEKYLSLLEQIRMNDELYHFKSKSKRSRWVDFFAAVFSSTKRRQMEQNFAVNTPRRPILGSRRSPDGDDEEGGYPHPGAAGYRKTRLIPTLRKMGKRQDEVYMTSISWVIPALDQQLNDNGPAPIQPNTPNINTCRPMSYQEDGAKVLCTAAVNHATFLTDHTRAINVKKEPQIIPSDSTPPTGKESDESSLSLVWIVTGVPNLTKVSILDAAAVGEVLETFPVCASPIQCITAIPGFDGKDPDVLAGLSSARRKPVTVEVQTALSDRPSSKHATMWMGSDSGVLYVHSAVSQWKKCIHADKLSAGIQCITHLKGKAYLLLQNANLAVFRRFPDGEWDWDNYSVVVLGQRKDLPCSAVAAVKSNIWCAVGNMVYVVHSHLLKMEVTFPVHSRKRAEVTQMVPVGDGVWVSFKYDSTLRLFNASSFTHMQDLDVAPSIHKILLFGSEKRSAHMPIQISSIIAAHNSLWVGTENGVLLAFPFNAPTMVAEESGWEIVQEAEVGGNMVPEPFDVRTEHAVEAGILIDVPLPQYLESSGDSRSSGGDSQTGSHRSESPLPPTKKPEAPKPKPFNPICNVDQVELSIHCHINAVKSLICVPGLVPKDLAMYEPLGGVYIGSGDDSQRKPALFVVSCGEGHLDLRTADKVLETLQAKENGQSGLPSAASIISEKNYIMVWDIAS